jgi:hypothetical protein
MMRKSMLRADNVQENPYLAAKTFEELERMEASLYAQCWRDDKLLPEMEDYYNHQMALFEQALSASFPEHYHHPQKKT